MYKKLCISILSMSMMMTIGLSTASAEGNENGQNNAFKNDNGIVINQKHLDNLHSLGFTDEEIQVMEREEFNQNKNIKGIKTVEKTQYLKITEITEEEGLNQKISISSVDAPEKTLIEELDENTFNEEVEIALDLEEEEGIKALTTTNTKTSYKTMTTSITKLSSTKFRVKNSVSWKKMPKTRYVDVSGVGINNAYWSPVPKSEYGKQTWKKDSICNPPTNGSATYTNSSSKWKRGAGGYALKMNLPNDDIGGGCGHESVESLSSYMYYTVEKDGSTKHLDAYGQYAHQEATFSATPSISLSGITFDVSPSSKFSHHPNTHTRFDF